MADPFLIAARIHAKHLYLRVSFGPPQSRHGESPDGFGINFTPHSGQNFHVLDLGQRCCFSVTTAEHSMSLNYAPQTVTADEYQRIFDLERQNEYPCIDEFEQRMGFAIERERLERIARVLSCPMKAAAPNWQHGRVLYAAARNYAENLRRFSDAVKRLRKGELDDKFRTLDIGTAKSFSALCVRLAVEDSGMECESFSVDVLPPSARVRRNTVAEVDGLKTLAEILEPFPEAQRIQFVESTGIDWLQNHPERIHIAFVDGKHSGSVVRREGVLISQRQQPGDLCIFDDVHIGDVSAAVTSLHNEYKLEYIQPLPKRAYAVGIRR